MRLISVASRTKKTRGGEISLRSSARSCQWTIFHSCRICFHVFALIPETKYWVRMCRLSLRFRVSLLMSQWMKLNHRCRVRYITNDRSCWTKRRLSKDSKIASKNTVKKSFLTLLKSNTWLRKTKYKDRDWKSIRKGWVNRMILNSLNSKMNWWQKRSCNYQIIMMNSKRVTKKFKRN